MPTTGVDANCDETKKIHSDAGATRFVSMAILIMLVGLVSLVYLNS
jgi:hypothetical protein